MSFRFPWLRAIFPILFSFLCSASSSPPIFSCSLARAKQPSLPCFLLSLPSALLSLYLLLLSSLSASHAHRYVYYSWIYFPLSLSPPFYLYLSPSFSHCSLSLRRRMSPTFESIARFRAHCLPSSPFCRPRARSSSFCTISSFASSAASFLNLLSPPPSLLFPQISSTIFAISITRAHLFLL